MESTDAELLDRSTVLIERIEQARFETLSKNFLRDTDGTQSYGLPGWNAYSRVAGVTRASKLLFLEMIRQQPELCSLIDQATDGEQPDAQDALRRCATAQSIQLRSNRLDRLQTPEIGDIAAILLATAQVDGQLPIEINEWLMMSAQVVPVTTYMQRRGYSQAVRCLYAEWLPKTHESMAYRALDIAMRYDLDTGAIIARRNLSAHLDSRLREVAILALAKFGDAQDIPSLLELFDDETLCQEHPKPHRIMTSTSPIFEADEAPPGAPPTALTEQQLVRYRICDLALGAALSLSGENLEDAFPYFVPTDGRGLDVRSVVVDVNEEQLAERREMLERTKLRLGEAATKR